MKTTDIFIAFLDILFPPSDEQRIVRVLSVQKIRNIKPPHDTPADFMESLFTWKHPDVRLLISELKYQRNTRALHLAAELLSEEMLYFLSEKQQFGAYINPLLVPIPMHRDKKRERGWNQAELLAREISKQIPDLNYAPILVKSKNSKRQTEVRTREERLGNIKDTFYLRDEEKVDGKDIILIDDVTTTGATLNEARTVLRKAGAREVHAFTLAH